jgi:hypothetical protein
MIGDHEKKTLEKPYGAAPGKDEQNLDLDFKDSTFLEKRGDEVRGVRDEEKLEKKLEEEKFKETRFIILAAGVVSQRAAIIRKAEPSALFSLLSNHDLGKKIFSFMFKDPKNLRKADYLILILNKISGTFPTTENKQAVFLAVILPSWMRLGDRLADCLERERTASENATKQRMENQAAVVWKESQAAERERIANQFQQASTKAEKAMNIFSTFVKREWKKDAAALNLCDQVLQLKCDTLNIYYKAVLDEINNEVVVGENEDGTVWRDFTAEEEQNHSISLWIYLKFSDAASYFKAAVKARARETREDLVQALELGGHYLLQAIEAYKVGNEEPAETLLQALQSICEVTGNLYSADKARRGGNALAAALYEKNAQLYSRAGAEYARGNLIEAHNSARSAITFMDKPILFSRFDFATEARQEGYKKAAETYEESAQYTIHAIEEDRKGNKEKANSLENSARDAAMAAGIFAYSASISENENEVQGLEKGAEYLLQAAVEQSKGNEIHAANLRRASSIFSPNVDTPRSVFTQLHKKALEAKTRGNEKVIHLCDWGSDCLLRAAVEYERGNAKQGSNLAKAAEIIVLHMIENIYKAAEARSGGSEVAANFHETNAQAYFRFAEEYASGNVPDGYRFDESIIKNCHAIEAFENAVKARSEKKDRAAHLYEQSALFFLKAAENKERCQHWTAVAYSFDSAARGLDREADATASENEKLARAYQKMIDYRLERVKAAVEGHEEKMGRLNKASGNASNAVGRYEDAAKASADGNQEVAVADEKGAQYYLKAAEEQVKGNENQAGIFVRAAWRSSGAVRRLKQAAEASATGRGETAKAHKKGSQYCLQAAEEYAGGNKQQAENFVNADYKISDAAKEFEEVVQANAAGKERVAQSHEKAAHIYLQAAEEYAGGNKQQAENFAKAAMRTSWAAKEFENVVEANAAGKRGVTLSHEKSAQYYLQAAEEYKKGNTERGQNLEKAVEVIVMHAVVSMDRAAEANSVGCEVAVKFYEQNNYYVFLAAEEYAMGNVLAAQEFENKVIRDEVGLVRRAVAARREGKEAEAETFEQGANYLLQAMEEDTGGNKERGLLLKEAAKCLSYAVSQRVQKTGAIESVAQLHEKNEQYYRQAAEEYAKGNVVEAEDLVKRVIEDADVPGSVLNFS